MTMAAAGVDVVPVGSVGAGVDVAAGVGVGDGVDVEEELVESSLFVERQKVFV
jgi:hypothetical protein